MYPFKLTLRTMPQVFARILLMEDFERRRIASAFDKALDELAEDDGFGTEQQLDPRGDPR